MEKPFINLLWSGTLLMAIGFGLSLRQRGRKGAVAEVSEVPEVAAAARPQVVG